MKQAPHVPEVTTGALAAQLAVGRKTLRRAVVAAQAVPAAARDARQVALARACATPGGQLRWTAADAEAVLIAHGRATSSVETTAPSSSPATSDDDPLARLRRETPHLLAYLLQETPHEEDAETEALALMGALLTRREQERSDARADLTGAELGAMAERAMDLGRALLRAARRRMGPTEEGSTP